jgi:ParB family transcriptional regulator, chromosome partitioning protein
MSRRRGLGSGLDALIPSGSSASAQTVRQILIANIRENRSQPRTRFDEQALDELAASIREHGIIQPIIVSEDGAGCGSLLCSR